MLEIILMLSYLLQENIFIKMHKKLKNNFKKRIAFFVVLILLATEFNEAFAQTADFQFSASIGHLPLPLQKILKESVSKEFTFEGSDVLEFKIGEIKSKIQSALEAQGYYSAELGYEIDFAKNKTHVIFKLNSGKAVIIDKIRLEKSLRTNFKYYKLSISPGDRLLAEKVLNEARSIADQIEIENCFPQIKISHQAIIDFNTLRADLVFKIEEQPQVIFGPIIYEGSNSVEFQYVHRNIPWNEGECFKVSKVNDFRKKLRQDSLFSQSDIYFDIKEISNNRLPIHVKVTDNLHRTIKIGVGYESDDGPGLYGNWEHENYFGQGENLEVSAKVSPINQYIKLNYLDPYFHKKKLKLAHEADFNIIDSDQYESMSFNAQSKIIHQFSNFWHFQYGLGYRLSNVKDKGDDEAFGFFYVPLTINYDSRDNILDPHEGMYFNLLLSPYFDTLSHADIFLKTRLDHNYYLSFAKNAFTVLASRISLGSILGGAFNRIPADLRYYAGGGMSVRGYEFQSLGEREDGESIGGRSLVECSFEMRQKITDQYGFVIFMDGGNVYRSEKIDFSDSLRWSSGLGIRYYSPFGPIRFDVGIPLNKREGIDDGYQIYFSIGQSF
ncbi:MAG: BamA/TamA family outer membrane protein [Flavobacteriales bacterium]|nr:BamA/TamA family outer membrane protein [Flavobacteriales bacterium]